MSLLNTENRFGNLSITLHWLTVLAIIIAYATMEFKGLAPKGPPRDLVKSIHFSAGLCVLGMATIRLMLYLNGSTPTTTPPPPQWQVRLARWSHGGLYLLMLLLPLLGWLIFSAKGKLVPLLGFQLAAMPLPATLVGNADAAYWFKDIHETLANIGYALIGLHAGAALLHHYILRDDTLTRMLPERR